MANGRDSVSSHVDLLVKVNVMIPLFKKVEKQIGLTKFLDIRDALRIEPVLPIEASVVDELERQIVPEEKRRRNLGARRR